MFKLRVCRSHHHSLTYIRDERLSSVFPHQCHTHSIVVTTSVNIFHSFFATLTNYVHFDATMSYATWDEDLDDEHQSTWPHIDLLEFVRPAILAMLFFMSLADGMRQPGLIIHVLNGQARFMVSLRLF